jgi:hypothetical protein
VLVPVEVPVAPVPPVAAPVPPVAAPVLGVVAAGVLAAPVPAVEPLVLPVPPEEDVVLGVVVDEGVELDALSEAVVDVPSPVAAAAPSEVLAGATSACGFFGTTSCVALLPPQAERPPVARSIRAIAVARRRMGPRFSPTT